MQFHVLKSSRVMRGTWARRFFSQQALSKREFDLSNKEPTTGDWGCWGVSCLFTFVSKCRECNFEGGCGRCYDFFLSFSSTFHSSFWMTGVTPTGAIMIAKLRVLHDRDQTHRVTNELPTPGSLNFTHDCAKHCAPFRWLRLAEYFFFGSHDSEFSKQETNAQDFRRKCCKKSWRMMSACLECNWALCCNEPFEPCWG